MIEFENIYTIFERIKFQERINKQCDLINRGCKSLTEPFLMADFVYGIVSDFYGEVMDYVCRIENDK